ISEVKLTHEGYTFDGWFTDNTYKTKFDFNSPITKDTVIYAKWTIKKYNVSFVSTISNVAIREEIATQSVAYKATASAPNVSYEGWTFVGWFTDTTYTTAFDFNNNLITKDTVVYAKWNINYYTVNFVSTISEVKVDSQKVPYMSTVSEPKTIEVNDYDFKGWYEDDAYTKRFDFATGKITKDTTLYAKYVKKGTVEYIVTKISEFEPKISTYSLAKGEKITRPASPSKVDGYTFIGWYANEARTIAFTFGEEVKSNVTMYAKFEINKYKVSFVSTVSNTAITNAIETQTVVYKGTVSEPKLSHEGYKFDGWYISDKYLTKFDFAKDLITKDTTLYAKWTINTYTVTFVSTISEVKVDSQKVVYNGKVTEPQTIEVTGYDFKGWYEDDAYTKKFDFANTRITKDIKLYAKYMRKGEKEYIITKISEFAPTISTYSVLQNRPITAAASPSEVKGYDFLGWFEDEGRNTPYTFGKPATSDVTIYAKWTKHKYKVTFVSTLSSAEINAAIKTQEVEYKEKPTEPKVSHDEYDFNGWFTTTTYTTKYDFSKEIEEDVTVYAKWTRKRSKVHTATLDAAGGKFDNSQSTMHVQVTEDEYFELRVPTRRGYVFGGYVVDGAKYENPNYIFNTDKTFIATWEPITFYIRYDGNKSNNDSIESMATIKITFEDAYTLKVNEFEKDGYTFDSWLFDNKEYDEEAKISDIIENMEITQDQVLVFTAKWDPNEYTITYNSNGGSGTMNASHPKFGTAFTLPAKTFTNGNKTFLGWNTDKDATKALYGDKGTINPEVYTANIELFAIWYEETDNTAKLIIDANGGLVNGVSSYTVMGELGDVLEIPSIEREGHTLLGFTENDIAYIVPEVFDFKGEKKIKATWSEILYNIIYNSNDGKGITKVVNDVRYNQVVTIIGSISETAGKIFESWNTDNLYNGDTYVEGQTVSKLSKVNGSTVNLYAKYNNHKVTITFNANTGSGTMADETYENNTNATIKSNSFTKAGYRFLGWSRNENATEATYNDGNLVDEITKTEDKVTLYAIWLNVDNTRYIIYDAKGGLVNGKSSDKVAVASGSTISHPTAIREGYVFNNWLDKDGNVFNKTIVDWKEDITVEASWTEGSYTLRYNGNGNTSGSMADETKVYSTIYDLTANTYGRTGYKFSGWDLSQNATSVVYRDRATISKLAKV
ncbi:MAG: InlB B-repeat-containing protein, partial [Lachnospiraceae bacterium]|nr:InlB B-repeat-containing protein [Lachnospiraceae bacterium]